jgi:hypothetical protein
MPQESRHAWFIRRLVSDAAVIGSATWLLLLVMELVKPGIVSFYIPLSKALFVLVCLGLVALSMQRPQISEPYTRQNVLVLSFLSLVSALVIYKVVDVEWWLTLLLILVTVGSIWASAILFSKS